MIVNKEAVHIWMSLSNERNARYVRDLSQEDMIEAVTVGAAFARNFFNSLRDCAVDDQTATHIIERAAFGVMHSASQALLFATPPTFDPPDEKVN